MKKLILMLFASFLIISYPSKSKEARILRYPDVSKDMIAFCHAGDIYTVSINGGLARKVTNSEGIEMYPRFSPDGKTIAFSAEYDGNREVYIMPAIGGEPERLTYSMDIQGLPARMGPDKIIMDWTKDGKKILYRSRDKSWNAWVGQLYYVATDGGMPEQLPLPKSGFASLSPDGKKIAYNRVFREYRTWKRYRGGQADDIWIYDFATKKLDDITNNDAQDIIPMWYNNKIYYLSDRDSRMNIYCYNLDTKETKKITDFRKYDVKFPAIGPDNIAFSNGGFIYLLDLKTDQFKKVNIEIAEDYPDARNTIVNVKDDIHSYEIAPDGKRALFTARGDVFTVPAKNGNIRNLTETSGVHERSAVWSPDGQWIAYISDETGTSEIFIIKPDGSDKTQLTDNGESYRFSLMWSPDSKKIICSDKTMKLYYIDVNSKKTIQVTKSNAWEIRDYTWSPDSKWIAYTDYAPNQMSVIYLYSLEDKNIYPVTDDFFNSNQPEFDVNGKYLFFVSDRTFHYSEGEFERSYVYNKMAKIYGITLQDTVKSPFAFVSDNVTVKTDDEAKKTNVKKPDEEKPALTIEMEGIKDRIFELPVNAGNYFHLVSKGDKLYYSSGGFKAFDLNKKEESEIGSFRNFEISTDGKFVLFPSNKEFYIEKLDAKVKPEQGKLNLEQMQVNLNRQEEWAQIFNEAWRQMKYFFYDPNMHGVDWKQIHDNYAEMVPYVRHRADLTYIIGEMIGELNVGHAYVGGGEMPKVKKIGIGLLGADFVPDDNGFYKITKIYKGRNWDESTRSPLTEPGIDIKEGDYIISINGKNMTKAYSPYKALLNKVDEFVRIKVNNKPSENGAKEYHVKTIASESELRYFNWVENNMRIVNEKSGGKIGYIHIPDMLSHGLNEFVKNYYPQLRKEGLIIDDRYNGGGNVSPMIIERLRRILTMAGHARNQQVVTTVPSAVFTGPMVCLINELSASDGDMFPYEFKKADIGELIGKRSWGGVIGIRGSLPFLDGSYLYKPEFSHFSPEGKWVLEGHGMEPDIVVDNNPAREYEGIDDQLDKAIEVVMKEIKEGKGQKLPKVPPFPDKSK